MKRYLPILLPLLMFLILSGPKVSHAATFTVDTNDDVDHGYGPGSGACPSPCSIRDAIIVSNDGDVVELPAALGGITFTTGGPIPIDTNLTIQGAGQNTTTIDGDNLGSIFEIDAAGEGKSVAITGVTLTKGNTTGDGGAIIVNLTGSLLLTDCTVTNSIADGHGGGIYSQGSLSINNCTISNNKADNDADNNDGGGIWTEGNLLIANSTLSGNSTGAGGGGDGGGLWLDSNGNMEIRDTMISDNTADADGGGIYKDDDTLNLIIAGTGDGLCVISGNRAASGDGGGIWNSDPLLIDNCLIDDNVSDGDGGGIYNEDDMVVRNSTISNNNSSGEGGGIYNSDVMTLEHSTVSDNTSDSMAGGIYIGSFAQITRSVISGNRSVNGDGGGIVNDDNLILEHSTVSNNSAENGSNGGGIYNTENIILLSSTISGNSADTDGGGIYNTNDVSTDIRNSTIFDNAANDDGGGIYQATSNTDLEETLNLSNVTIANNQADADSVGGGIGGGLYNEAIFTSIGNSIIANNSDDGTAPDCFSDFTNDGWIINSIGPNIITNTNGCEILGLPVTEVNPNLAAALANNGGPTQGDDGAFPTLTLALLAGSPAIDAGDNNTCEADDQRGTSRPQGTNCDLGAFEAGPSADLSSTEVNFGEQEVGTSSEMDVTLTNNGTIELTINDISITLLGSEYSQTNDCGASLAVGTFCTITITFGPTQTGVLLGSVTVDTSATSVAQLISLIGAGFTGGGGCNLQANPNLDPMANATAYLLLFMGIGGLSLMRKRVSQG